VVTDMGILHFYLQTREMFLTALHPSISVEQVRQSVGWPLTVADELVVTDPPTTNELRIISEELDPQGIYR
jgi:glutaconate CoA-transferase, subunit B